MIVFDETEWAWAAGLFDGEGSATVCGKRPRLAVKMTDECVLLRLEQLGGKVYGPYENAAATRRDGSPRRSVWLWIAVREDALRIIERLLPYLSEPKREQIERSFHVKRLAA